MIMPIPLYLSYFVQEKEQPIPAKALPPEYGAYIAEGSCGDPGKLRAVSRAKQNALKRQASDDHYCCECGDWRPTHMFARRASGGYDSYCKMCRSLKQKQYRLRKALAQS